MVYECIENLQTFTSVLQYYFTTNRKHEQKKMDGEDKLVICFEKRNSKQIN